MSRHYLTNNRAMLMQEGEGPILDFFKSGLNKGRNFLGNLLRSDATKAIVNNLVNKGVEKGSEALARKLAGNGLRLAGQRGGRKQRGRGSGAKYVKKKMVSRQYR